MGEAVEVDIIANDKASPAWKQQAEMVHKYLAELAKLDSTQKANEKSAREYDKAAKQTFESTRTPVEQYRQKLAELKKQLDAGTISQQTYNRAVGQLHPVMNQNAVAAERTSLGFGAIASRVSGAVAGYVTLTSVVNMWKTANQEAMRAAEDAASKMEDRLKRFQVQAGLNDIEGAAAQKDLGGIAMRTAMPLEQVNDIATMIVSSGGTKAAARGAGTEEIAKFIKAQGLKGDQVDAEGFTDSITRYLISQGETPSEGNIGQLVKKLQSGGIKSTKFKIPDLQHLAAIGADLKTFGMSQDEQLSQFALMGDVYGGEAHTKMRDLVQNLATVGGKPDAQPWLKKMGLKSTDIDMVGEDFPTAVKTLKKGLDKLPEADRNSALKKIIEGTNIGAINQVAGTMERAAGVKAGLGDFSEYESDVKTMTTGRNADEQRLKVRNEMLDAAADTQSKNDRLRLVEAQKRAGLSPFLRSAQLVGYDTMDYMFGHQKHMETVGGPQLQPKLAERREQQDQAFTEVVRALDENTKAMRDESNKPKKFEAKVDPAPARPVPAAALGRAG